MAAYIVGIGMKRFVVEDDGTVKMPDGSTKTLEELTGQKPIPVPATTTEPEPEEPPQAIPEEATGPSKEELEEKNMLQLKREHPGIWKPWMTKKDLIERILNGNTDSPDIDNDSN